MATACSTVSPAPPPKVSDHESYRVGAPDRLTVTILPDPRIENTVTVRADGMISVDLIGDVPASGRTVLEIAADIQKRIARYRRNPSVTVALVESESTEIILLGEVMRPGAFPLAKQTRVAEAIATVGGLTAWGFASGRNVRLIRTADGETAVHKVDMTAIGEGDLRTNAVLVAGDIIYVPSTFWAKVGYVFNAVLFPFQPFMGVANSAAGTYLAPGR